MAKQIAISDLAYTGGIIDGEGCIGIKKAKSKYSKRGYYLELQVQVVNTDEWLVRWLFSKYGGCVCRRKAKKVNWKDSWEWKVQTNQALKFLLLILPYVRMKRAQAELAIKFGNQRKQGKKTKREIAIEENQRRTMLSYNHKGK